MQVFSCPPYQRYISLFPHKCSHSLFQTASVILSTRAGEPETGVFGSLEQEPEPFFLAPWSRSRSRSRSRKKLPGAGAAWGKNKEPEPLEKKTRAGAAKKLAGSPALQCQHYGTFCQIYLTFQLSFFLFL